MPLSRIINNLCIDDAVSILKFCEAYEQNPGKRIKENETQKSGENMKEDNWEFDFAGKKYFFYSKKVNIMPIISILTRDEKHGKFEYIKEKVVHGIQKKFQRVIISKEEIERKLNERIKNSIRIGYPIIY